MISHYSETPSRAIWKQLGGQHLLAPFLDVAPLPHTAHTYLHEVIMGGDPGGCWRQPCTQGGFSGAMLWLFSSQEGTVTPNKERESGEKVTPQTVCKERKLGEDFVGRCVVKSENAEMIFVQSHVVLVVDIRGKQM